MLTAPLVYHTNSMRLKDKAKNRRGRIGFSNPDIRALLTLFAASVAFRLLFLYEISAMPTFDHPVMDEGYHVELAQEILAPGLTQQTPYYRAPLYPYFMTDQPPLVVLIFPRNS